MCQPSQQKPNFRCFASIWWCSVCLLGIKINEQPHDKTNKLICVPSKDSDQPSLISLRCPYKETLGPQLPIEHTAQAESSLGAQIILMVLSWDCSYENAECTWNVGELIARNLLERRSVIGTVCQTCSKYVTTQKVMSTTVLVAN